MTTFDWKKIAKPASQAGFVKAGSNTRDPRATITRGITKQLDLLAKPEAKGFRWYKASADGKQASLSVRYGTRFVPLLGEETTIVVPGDQLKPVLEGIAASVQAGEYDEVLKGISERVGRKADGSPKAKPVRKAKEPKAA